MVDTLTHEQAYSQINDGDIMFVANARNPVARIIEWATNSQYSHVAFLFWITTSGIKRLMVIEAQGGADRRILDFEFYNRKQLHIVAAVKPWAKCAPLALQRIGKVKYGYMEAFYVGLREFTRKNFGITLPRRDFQGEICSEFVARVLTLLAQDVSPQDVFDEVTKTSSVRFYISAEKETHRSGFLPNLRF